MRFYKKKHEASQGQMADVKTKNNDLHTLTVKE